MWLRPVIFLAIEFCQITMFVMDSQDFAKHKSFVPGPTYVPPPWPSPQKGLDHKIDSNWLTEGKDWQALLPRGWAIHARCAGPS